jgi:hypothetical protein
LRTTPPPGSAPPSPVKSSTEASANDPAPSWLWPNGSDLRVKFLDGTADQKAKFKLAIQSWLAHANLTASYPTARHSQVRVSFAQQGSWSYLGTRALEVEENEPTITLGFTSPPPALPANYLHEVGHMLGLVHEIKNPDAKLPWDKKAVYEAFAKQGWDRATVDANLFGRESYPGSRRFDRSSIMLMDLPPEVFTDRQGVTLPNELSPGDIAYIAQLYPKQSGRAHRRAFILAVAVASNRTTTAAASDLTPLAIYESRLPPSPPSSWR